jgi:hypothetical protein
MSALVNHNNEITVPLIKWKQNVFYQLGTKLQATQDTNNNTTGSILFKARPIKHAYRRERGVNTTLAQQSRASATIDLASFPGGTVLYTAVPANCPGYVQTLESKTLLPNNQGLLGNVCNVCNNNGEQCLSTSSLPDNVCFTPETNARRRVRSAGMIQKKYKSTNPDAPDPVYFTNNRQYLISKNRTIEQNNYSFIRVGDPTTTPGTAASKTNVYAPQGLSHCKKTLLGAAQNNNVFEYIWTTGETFTVTLPEGYYDLFSFNRAFQLIMFNNGHFYVNDAGITAYLFNFTYNTLTGRVELQVFPGDPPATGDAGEGEGGGGGFSGDWYCSECS